MDAFSVVKEYSILKSERGADEADWRELETYLSPDREEIRQGLDNPVVVDSTGYNSLENHTGGVFGALTNPANKWVGFATEDEDLNNFHSVKTALNIRSHIVLKSMGASMSSFYRSIAEFWADEAQFGNAIMYSEVDQKNRRFLDVKRPLSEMYVRTDGEGEDDLFIREMELTPLQAKKTFGDKTPLRVTESKSNPNKKFTFLHAVFENTDKIAGRIGFEGMEYNSLYVFLETKETISRGGYHVMPFDRGRRVRRTGRNWGTGLGHKALPDLRMLSAMGVDMIDLANFIARPPVLMADESSVDISNIRPNSPIYGGIDERTGKQMVDYLINGGQLPITMEMLQQTREMVRETFQYSMMQMVNRTGVSIEELLDRDEQKLRTQGPHLVRQQNEVLTPFVTRRYLQLERLGLFPPAPPELQGQLLGVTYESPMARAIMIGEAQATIRLGATIREFAEIDPSVADNWDGDAAIQVVRAGLGAPAQVLRGSDAVKEKRAERAEAEAQQAQLEQADQMGSIAQKVSQAAVGLGGRPEGGA